MQKAVKNKITLFFVLLAMLTGVFTLAACGNKDGGNHADKPTNPTVNQGGIVVPEDVLVLTTGDESNQASDASETGTTAATSDGVGIDLPAVDF